MTMKSANILLAALVFLNMATARSARAEEGMYPMSELSGLDLEARGVRLGADELFNPKAISLVDGVCRVNGCTGSFVSSQGLIITNHHCAYGAIQKASTAERDLLRDGFQARERMQEIPAPDYTVRVTEDYRDVSGDVLSAVSGNTSFLERTKAIERRRKELEKTAESENPGLRAEVAEMFAGKTYVLFLYTYLKDVRLVFAPPQSIGNFGGEVDNWMWPRHTGDFSFMRAYVAPDGSSQTYDEENVPYVPKRFIQVAPEGVQEEDAVFLLGYPGRTARHKTASFLGYEQQVRLPMIVDVYNWQIDVMSAAGEHDRSVEIRLASRIRSLANVEKRSRGQLKGLRRASIAAGRAAEESDLQAFIEADGDRKAKYGDVLSKIDSVYAEQARTARRDILTQQLTRACKALELAYFAYDYAKQRELSDVERETVYTDRNIGQSIEKAKNSIRDYHLGTDIEILAGLLMRLEPELGVAGEEGALAALLEAPKQAAERLLIASKMPTEAFLVDCLERSANELEAVDDPAMQLIVELYGELDAIRLADKQREGQLGQLYGDLIDVKQDFLATNFVPDANGTLRFTCGYVRRYSPEDAVVKLPISTLSGVVDKTTGQSPFDTPAIVLEKYQQRDFGPFLNAALGDIPVAILYNTDTTGGNSGSPIFNAEGKLVGVNFDRCFEATINDFAWNESYSRSIGVDIRYVLWITGYVYHAKHLLIEMGVDAAK